MGKRFALHVGGILKQQQQQKLANFRYIDCAEKEMNGFGNKPEISF